MTKPQLADWIHPEGEWTEVEGELPVTAKGWAELNRSADDLAVAEGLPCPWCDQKLSHPVMDGMHTKCFEVFEGEHLDSMGDMYE